MLFPIASKSLELRQQSESKNQTKQNLQSSLKPYLLHIVLLQHNEKQEALTLTQGISKSFTTRH
jgi:hypothetical protein